MKLLSVLKCDLKRIDFFIASVKKKADVRQRCIIEF